MWGVPRREGPEERCERLLALYDQQIADLEASRPSTYWDGYCGLVKVCDEDYVRPDSGQNTAAAARTAVQAQQHDGRSSSSRRQHEPSRTQGMAAAAASGASRPQHAHRGVPSPACTPPAGSPRISPGSSPFKPGPGALPRYRQSAAVLAEQAALLLQHQGRLRDAQDLLHAALRACPTSDTQLAARCIDLLLEAEREAQDTPSHSRAPSDVEPGDGQLGALLAGAGEAGDAASGEANGGGGAAAAGEATALLRGAVEALAAGEERRAAGMLLRAADACPREQVELRRRVELYLQLVQKKGR